MGRGGMNTVTHNSGGICLSDKACLAVFGSSLDAEFPALSDRDNPAGNASNTDADERNDDNADEDAAVAADGNDDAVMAAVPAAEVVVVAVADADKIAVGVAPAFGADDDTRHDCIHPCHNDVTNKVYRAERIADVTEEKTKNLDVSTDNIRFPFAIVVGPENWKLENFNPEGEESFPGRILRKLELLHT
ncbi:hypothetical protein HZH66_001055 [Vespula vulgaris]|uniref:Uncharacterized protein n=2 Tax=Vespula TaxID=7451 RepID=A0A834PFR7_VESPE|nr:hypothetical protein HZH66_001055 [Vespula vulgaris]KAF7438878.1 hypothetical protein H0235_001269 [Vespula pensylvanica]